MPPPLLSTTKSIPVFVRSCSVVLLLLATIRKADGIAATIPGFQQSVRTGRNTLSIWLHAKRTATLPFQTINPSPKRLNAHCPCQFRIRATYNSLPFDLVLVPNVRLSRRTEHIIQHRNQLRRIKLLQTFQKLNRSALNADRTDPLFHYHTIHIPFSISVTLLVRRSHIVPTIPSVRFNPSTLSTLLLTPSVSQSQLIHVHLITSLRSARCPTLLGQTPQNETDSSSSSSSVDNGDNTAKPRVVGGDTSGNDIAKSMVYFLIRSNDGRTKACSGTLVSQRTVITAAHCGVDYRSIAYLGGRQGYPSSGKRYSISRVHVPTLFNSLPENDFRHFYYDVAVVILSEDAPPDSTFMLVNVNKSLPLAGSAVRVAGYGILAHDDVTSNKNSVLHHVDVPVVMEKTCKSLYAKQGVDIDYDFQVCAGYVGRGGCDSW